MGKLRHLAITVPDTEKAAQFYEKIFDMKRVRGSSRSIHLTDGVMNLALLKFPTDEAAGDERGKDFHGLHHFGFVVDDITGTADKIEKAGGTYHMRLPSRQDSESEVKFRDPNGVVFDIVVDEYATKSWGANTKV
jgi:predicted enzyme related to lactoylglutathione lyase